MKDMQIYFKGFTVADPMTYENLTIFPLFREEAPGTYYLMLDEALKKGIVTVTEVNDTGRVAELWVRNDADIPVLLLDGEELSGAKQDRILNASILVPAESAMTIPVSCVEQGRWHYKSRTFSSKDRMYKPTDRGRKAKRVYMSVKSGRGFNAGQSEVWEEVSCLHTRFGTHSKTNAMADIYDNQKGNLESYINGISIADGQTGFVALINGNIIGLEALSLPEAFKQTYPKLIKSYALDAIDMRTELKRFPPLQGEGQGGDGVDYVIPPLEKGDKGGFEATTDSITNWLSTITPQNISIHKSPGLGKDIRWDETGTAGFVLDYNDEAVHTAVFVI